MKNLRLFGWPFLLAGLVGLLLFAPVLNSRTILFTTDNGIGNEAAAKRCLPHGIEGVWGESPLLGFGGTMPANWTTFCLWLLPLPFYMNWMHYLDLLIATGFLCLYLARRGVRPGGVALGALAAFWAGTNFSIVYAGQTGKFAVLALMSMALYALDNSARGRSMAWAALAGGAMGMALLEQPDVTMFFGLFWAAYLVHAVVREHGWRWWLLLRLALAAAVVGLLVGGAGSLGLYVSQTQGVSVGSGESPQAKWEFATQWSWPPEESVDFIAPGYTGWRSGEPDGPYWGRMGRSAEWESTGQGFMNFKLENEYLGAIPVLFALIAVFVATRKQGLEPGLELSARHRRADILFWSLAAALSLLLAFGKYFPLYAVFYQLPVVSSIRNPAKFLHVFQVALAILAACGLDAVLAARSARRE